MSNGMWYSVIFIRKFTNKTLPTLVYTTTNKEKDMSKFNKGDKVCKIDDTPFFNGDVWRTVHRADERGYVTFTVDGGHINETKLKLYQPEPRLQPKTAPHVHAKLIKKWADDTSQIVFVKSKKLGSWFAMDPLWNADFEHFVVCAKHADIALHWLNGGKVEFYGHTTGNWRIIDHPTFDRGLEYRKARTEEQKDKIKMLRSLISINQKAINNHAAKMRDLTADNRKIETEIANLHWTKQ